MCRNEPNAKVHKSRDHAFGKLFRWSSLCTPYAVLEMPVWLSVLELAI